MDAMEVQQATLNSVATTLRASADDLESSISEPPAVEAGEVTPVIEAGLAMVTEQLGTIAVTLNAAADEVAAGHDVYVSADDAAAEGFGGGR